jgi:malate synthase
MDAYSKLVIQRCHKRGIHAMGGMAAQIPINIDPEANEAALLKVRLDKEREVQNGHDGTWVAHPALVKIAMDVFDQQMPQANQLHRKLEDLIVTEADLVELPQGKITEAGVRNNINVGILYIEAWLRGYGAVALYHLMEDAATAEISRTQVWQWLNAECELADGRKLTFHLYSKLFNEELASIYDSIPTKQRAGRQFAKAAELFDQLVRRSDFVEFLTIPAYKLI